MMSEISRLANMASTDWSWSTLFADLDNDGWQDLVISQNTGEIEMFRNNKDSTFTAIPTKSGFGFWMGLGVGDIDKDGDQDLFFSNVGGSIPAFLTTGDIRDDQRHELEWLLLRNDGDFNFTDITKEYGITGEGFAWGGIFEDLNLDGHLDLVVVNGGFTTAPMLNKVDGTVVSISDPPSILLGLGGGRFTDGWAELEFDWKTSGRGLTIADVDDDGDDD